MSHVYYIIILSTGKLKSFQILAATLVYCFETPVLLTGAQRETIGTCVPLLFHPPGEIKLPVARVVVYDTILLLNIFMNMPSSLPAKCLEATLKGMKCDIKFK